MSPHIEDLKKTIELLELDLTRSKAMLTMAINACSHEWGEVKCDRIQQFDHHRIYEEDVYRRECLKCGTKQSTTKWTTETKRIPKW